jgi:predicted lipase
MSDGALFIVFQGSNGLKDWADNLDFKKRTIPYEGVNPDILVHEGFISQYKAVRKIIHEKIKSRIGGSLIVYCTGHSLGGALATLCAVDIQYNFSTAFPVSEGRLTCITFGSPRVGNAMFAESYDARVPATLRVVNGDDIVTKVPMLSFQFSHVGQLVGIGKKHWWKILGSTNDHYPQRYLENIR